MESQAYLNLEICGLMEHHPLKVIISRPNYHGAIFFSLLCLKVQLPQACLNLEICGLMEWHVLKSIIRTPSHNVAIFVVPALFKVLITCPNLEMYFSDQSILKFGLGQNIRNC